MKLAGLLLLVAVTYAQPHKVTITGTFKNPDGSAVNGTIFVSPSQKSATYICGGSTPLQLSAVTATITNGVLGSLQIYPSVCLSPANGGSVTGASMSGGSGFAGACTVKFTGPGQVMPATATCLFSNSAPIIQNLLTKGVYKVTTPPIVTFSCNPLCPLAVDPKVTVGYLKGQLYTVQVVAKDGTILYATSWSVPDVQTINITQLQ
jgi:hypothetical protein